jgi:hypothetical protein
LSIKPPRPTGTPPKEGNSKRTTCSEENARRNFQEKKIVIRDVFEERTVVIPLLWRGARRPGWFLFAFFFTTIIIFLVNSTLSCTEKN